MVFNEKNRSDQSVLDVWTAGAVLPTTLIQNDLHEIGIVRQPCFPLECQNGSWLRFVAGGRGASGSRPTVGLEPSAPVGSPVPRNHRFRSRATHTFSRQQEKLNYARQPGVPPRL